ncbi:MAG: response regulator transcription factor [Georgfuchsia sp.]
MVASIIAIDTGDMQTETPTSVYIVDDSFPIRERLAGMLAGIKGVSVVGEAESPAFAIKGIIATHPDSVVLDLHLRGGTGIEVLEKVASIAPEVVFIVLTNYPNSHYRKACLKAGASYFLDKTTEFEKVIEIIAALGATRH